MEFKSVKDVFIWTNCLVDKPEEFRTYWLDDLNEIQEKFVNSLNEQEKKVFEDFMYLFKGHMDEVRLKDCENDFFLGFKLGVDMEKLYHVSF